MNNRHSKAFLVQLLTQGEEAILIDLLVNQLKGNDSFYDTSILIASNYHSVQKKYAKGLLNSQDYELEMRKTRDSLQYLINELPDDILINADIEKTAKKRYYFNMISIIVAALILLLAIIWLGSKKSGDIDIELQIKSSSIIFEPSTNKGLLEEAAQIKVNNLQLDDIQWIDSNSCEIELLSQKDKIIWEDIYDKNGSVSINQTLIKQIGLNAITTLKMVDKNVKLSNKNPQGEEMRVLIDSTNKIAIDQSSAEATIEASVKKLCELNLRYKSVSIEVKDSIKINQYAIPIKNIAFQETKANESKSSIIQGKLIIGETTNKFEEIPLKPNEWLNVDSSDIKNMTINELIITNKDLSVSIKGKVKGLNFASKDLMPSRIEWFWHYYKYWFLLGVFMVMLLVYLFIKYRSWLFT